MIQCQLAFINLFGSQPSRKKNFFCGLLGFHFTVIRNTQALQAKKGKTDYSAPLSKACLLENKKKKVRAYKVQVALEENGLLL